MVGRLVEHQQVGPPGHQQGQVGPGALARRQGRRPGAARRPPRGRTSRAGCAPRPRPGRSRPGTPAPGRSSPGNVRRTWSTSPTTTLRPEPGPAGRQRQPTQQRGQQGRLARAVGAGDREALSPAYGEIDRPEPETAEVDHRRREPGHLVRPAGRRVEREPQLPGVARVLHLLEPVELAHQPAGRGAARLRPRQLGVADVLVRLVGPRLRAGRPGLALPRPLLLPAGPVDQGAALLVVGLVGRLRGRPGPLALLEVGREAAAEHRALAAELVDLEHRGRHPLEEGAVVRDDDQPAVAALEERLEQRQPVDVEVVGRLVEEQDVGLGEQDGSQAAPGQLAAGEGRGLAVEQRPRPDRAGRPRRPPGCRGRRRRGRASAPAPRRTTRPRRLSRPPARPRPRAARRPRRRPRYAGPGTAAASPRSAGRAPAAAGRRSRSAARA